MVPILEILTVLDNSPDAFSQIVKDVSAVALLIKPVAKNVILVGEPVFNTAFPSGIQFNCVKESATAEVFSCTVTSLRSNTAFDLA
jgi:hypothetical protein